VSPRPARRHAFPILISLSSLAGRARSRAPQCLADSSIEFAIPHDLTDQELEAIGAHALRLVERHSERLPTLETLRAASNSTFYRSESVVPRALQSTERRPVTVMFSDLVGSTALSSLTDLEDLQGISSAYQRCVADTTPSRARTSSP
jgi:hypothetical protein